MRIYRKVPLALSVAALSSSFFAMPVAAQGVEEPEGEAALIIPPIVTDGGTESTAWAVSADGNVVVGIADYFNDGRVVIWNRDDGFSQVTTLENPVNLKTYQPFQNADVSLSADGNVIGVNLRDVSETSFNSVGAIYRENNWFLLGDPDEDHTTITGLSDTGAVAVGSRDGQAVRWMGNASGYDDGMGLGLLWDGDRNAFSSASDVSNDGAMVVGSATSGSYLSGQAQVTRYDVSGFVWTTGGMVELPNPFERQDSHYAAALAVSGDGSVIVGYADTGTSSNTQALKWEKNEQQQYFSTELPYLGEYDTRARALDASLDGSVIVGFSGFGSRGTQHTAVRWTRLGAQSISGWLIDNGVEIGPDAPLLAEARGVSADGNTIVGTAYEAVGDDGEGGIEYEARGFIATTDGFIIPDGPDGVMNTLTGAGYGPVVGTTGSLMQHGAHSQPMQRRVGNGKTALWAAGDIGRDDHASRDGEISLGEVGIAHSMGDMQLNLSAGGTWVDQDLPQNGTLDADSLFVMGEVIAPLAANNLFFTLTSFYQWGDAEIVRGYLNAGLPDFSRGTPDTKGWGVRGRIDAVDAYIAGEMRFSPYVDVSYARTTIDAYTETGGGFPAMFNEFKDKRTEARLGLNAQHPVGEGISLLANAEAAHRFEKNGGTTSGQLVGLGGFSFTNANVDQTWAKGGLGISANMNGSTFFLMGNATTEGSMPSMWLAASYMMNF